MSEKIHLIRVMYAPEFQTWFWTAYDADDNQLAEAVYDYRMTESIASAEAEARTHDPRPKIEVYHRHGGLKKVIEP